MVKEKNTWLVAFTYVDPKTKFVLTESHLVYGTFRDAFEETLFNKDSFDIRITRYSPKDETSQ